MPRQSRLDAPYVLHHIMIRGIEGRRIFRNNKDRKDFLDRLGKLLPLTETACYAWSFMPNHAHLLFRTGLTPISTLMRKLLTGYVVTFNRRHNRHGQLFQNRYKSIVCQEETYLKELVRYIHLNPIRGGIVSGLKELSKYPYCGHSAVTGNLKNPWQDVDYVLSFFGRKVKNAREAYIKYVAEGINLGRQEDLVGGGLIRSMGGWSEVMGLRKKRQDHVMSDERILGDSGFVESILSQADEKYERRYEIKRLGYNLENIAKRVAEIYKIEPGEVFSKGKQPRKVQARSLFCFWAVKELGLSLRELARRLEISSPGVGYSVERGELIARRNKYNLID